MFDKGKKTGLEDVSRSLRRSRVRSEIMMYLYNSYPEASYPAEIAKDTGIDSKNIIKGLKGTGWLDVAKSLLKQGVVEEIERENETYYRLSDRGKSLVESMQQEA
jgi:predicted transcriptional regulator with HTH domain